MSEFDRMAFGSSFRTRPKRACPCGQCQTIAGFCPDHAARLAGIAVELKEANRRAGGKRTIAGTQGVAHDGE